MVVDGSRQTEFFKKNHLKAKQSMKDNDSMKSISSNESASRASQLKKRKIEAKMIVQ
jgi:hypothetical protein